MKKQLTILVFISLFFNSFDGYAAEQKTDISRIQRLKSRLSSEVAEFKKCIKRDQTCDRFRRNMYLTIGALLLLLPISKLMFAPKKPIEIKRPQQQELELYSWEREKHMNEINWFTDVFRRKVQSIQKMADRHILGEKADQAREKLKKVNVVMAEYEEFSDKGKWVYASQFAKANKYLKDMIDILDDKTFPSEGQKLGQEPAKERPTWTQHFLERRAQK